MKKISAFILAGLLTVIILSSFALASYARVDQNQVPQNIEQLKGAGAKFWSGFPGALRNIGREIYDTWIWATNKFISFWNASVQPWLVSQWSKVKSFFNREVEQRKPSVEQEFEKEKKEIKQEVKTEIPKAGKTIWEKFKELIR